MFKPKATNMKWPYPDKPFSSDDFIKVPEINFQYLKSLKPG